FGSFSVFFSSRRRHTSFSRDWSSDVCSSDLLALAFSAWAQAATVGQAAPDFELKDEEGKTHKLSQYRGKIVVLEWVNPECPFVKRHYDARTMQTTWEGSDKEKVVWLSIDSTHHNTPEKSREWKKARGFSYPVLQDPDGKVGKLYGEIGRASCRERGHM